jgi:murein DD-endopeptidase MepM/ murein hydrolase activator NlpD
LDHGHGVSSVFSHLSKLAVQPGETVAQGQVVGYVGATGRVTGAHLDWRVNWFEQRLDPALIAGPMPAPAVK